MRQTKSESLLKTCIKNLLLVLACTGLLVMPAAAQTFTNLYSFTNSPYGFFPDGGLILSGNTLYGTTDGGGTNYNGTVFAVNTDGTGFTNLHNFTGGDGAEAVGSLILSGNTLYGTASTGGSSGNGTVFAINTDGTGFTNLYSFTATSYPDFTNSDGAYPKAGLILSDDTLYGTAFGGGGADNGTVFAVNTDGTGFRNLYSFTAWVSGTKTDGAIPEAGLILSGDTLYGTTDGGGNNGYGTVFAVNTDGTGFTNLHSLTTTPVSLGMFRYVSQAGLILSGNTLYGTIGYGGSSGDGAVFALSLVPPLSITETNN
ncbi:MAG: choice-of-anchor tandem repeat GloVer-containing protein, partial [Verrucomicrobiota bacterium]